MDDRKIAIDTEILIILAGGATAIPNGPLRARQIIKDHMAAKEHIYIPAPAYAECCHVQEDLMAKMRISPFGFTAAVIANKIAKAVVKLPRSVRRPTRQAVKVDTMILATAEAIQAAIFYVGDDGWFTRAAEAAKLKVNVRELPELHPEQLVLNRD